MAKGLVLVVEDNSIMLEGIRDTLEMDGYQVVTALDGLEALERLEQHHPDLIVSDIMMPRLDGYQFFSAVRANSKWVDIPFVFLTAKNQRVDVRLGKQLGADDYLTKPFEAEDLLVVVQAKLERAAVLRASAELEISKLKQNILNTLSHEFRTPLTYIRGYLDLILDEGPERLGIDDLGSFLQRVKRGSDRLSALVDDFIFMVMLETGEIAAAYRLNQTYVEDICELIQAVVAEKTPEAQQRDVRLEIDVIPPLPGTVLHVGYIQNALGRLLDNAIKFSRKGERVVVRVRADEEWIDIAVQDRGIGIAPKEIPHLFKRFHQIDREQQEQQGIGAGLVIVKGIVDIHGGRVEVQSRVGQGSTFKLILPVLGKPAD
jgi:two-component system sensor histidine kinase/response regulator